jgi:hypothetical protein
MNFETPADSGTIRMNRENRVPGCYIREACFCFVFFSFRKKEYNYTDNEVVLLRSISRWDS